MTREEHDAAIREAERLYWLEDGKPTHFPATKPARLATRARAVVAACTSARLSASLDSPRYAQHERDACAWHTRAVRHEGEVAP